MTAASITAAPLTAEAFRPFGDVIAPDGAPDMMINGGRCERFHDLAQLSFEGGRAGISIFRSDASPLPYVLELMERHPVGSQAFLPMSASPYLVVVATDDAGKPGALHAFLAGPGQGVNYRAGTWHAPLIALEAAQPFAVVDRIGDRFSDGGNLEEFSLPEPVTVVIPAA